MNKPRKSHQCFVPSPPAPAAHVQIGAPSRDPQCILTQARGLILSAHPTLGMTSPEVPEGQVRGWGLPKAWARSKAPDSTIEVSSVVVEREEGDNLVAPNTGNAEKRKRQPPEQGAGVGDREQLPPLPTSPAPANVSSFWHP